MGSYEIGSDWLPEEIPPGAGNGSDSDSYDSIENQEMVPVGYDQELIMPSVAGEILSAREVAQQYMAILRDSSLAYQGIRAQLNENRQRIEPALDSLYEVTEHRYLRPDNLKRLMESDRKFLDYIDIVDQARPTAEQLLLTFAAAPAEAKVGWSDVSPALAAASVRRTRDPKSARQYRKFIGDDSIRQAVLFTMVSNQNAFLIRGVTDLSPEELAKYGIDGHDLDTYSSYGAMTQNDLLPRLDGPPLHLTQLSADVMNFNTESAIPSGDGVFWRRSSWQQTDTGYREIAQKLTSLHAAYLRLRYGYESWPSQTVISALAECDLAERQGFMHASDAQQIRTAQRAAPIFAKIKSTKHLPPEAQVIFDRCRELSGQAVPSRRSIGR